MTLIEVELFRNVPAHELLSKQLSQPARAPRFHAYVRKFNEWGRWAATEVSKYIRTHVHDTQSHMHMHTSSQNNYHSLRAPLASMRRENLYAQNEHAHTNFSQSSQSARAPRSMRTEKIQRVGPTEIMHTHMHTHTHLYLLTLTHARTHAHAHTTREILLIFTPHSINHAILFGFTSLFTILTRLRFVQVLSAIDQSDRMNILAKLIDIAYVCSPLFFFFYTCAAYCVLLLSFFVCFFCEWAMCACVIVFVLCMQVHPRVCLK